MFVVGHGNAPSWAVGGPKTAKAGVVGTNTAVPYHLDCTQFLKKAGCLEAGTGREER